MTVNPEVLVSNNPLEGALIAAKGELMPFRDFLTVLLASEVACPSMTQIHADGTGWTPLLFNKEGTDMVAIFTSLDRAKKFTDMAPFVLTMNMRAFLGRLSREFGVVLNPGYTQGLDISPEGIANIIRDFW